MRTPMAIALLATLTLGAGVARAQAPGSPAKGKPVMSQDEVAKRVRTAINATGPQIDACVERHLSEFPKATGFAQISVTVGLKGSVTRASVETALEGARNLRYCLERIAKSWRFPEPQKESPVTLKVPVEKGNKFRIPEPGEKPPEGAKQPPREGFINFLPGSFIPQAGPPGAE